VTRHRAPNSARSAVMVRIEFSNLSTNATTDQAIAHPIEEAAGLDIGV
jgi:hypothetical protein